ncbi:hypothetical protein [uncultured Roseobacter sp.]|uniref:hypothetical protein n=1 Tax=uncultured Roseobacter sp. TaxID=114847 RepID=UPI0026208796|nr:hypothetical protein [uncultured Roseobacter sp.]
MTANVAEWLMAAASIATGGFVGWQSMTLNNSLNYPFEANLQDRQIEVCAAAIRAEGNYLSAQSIIAVMASNKFFSSDEAGPDGSSKKLEYVGGWNPIDALSTATGELRGALAELKIYSSDYTKSAIERVELGLSGFSYWTDGEESSNVETLQDKDVEAAFAAVELACEEAMLGKKKGLL